MLKRTNKTKTINKMRDSLRKLFATTRANKKILVKRLVPKKRKKTLSQTAVLMQHL